MATTRWRRTGQDCPHLILVEHYHPRSSYGLVMLKCNKPGQHDLTSKETAVVRTHRKSGTKSLDGMRETETTKVSHRVEKERDSSEPKKRARTAHHTERQSYMKKLRLASPGSSRHTAPVSTAKHSKSALAVRKESSRKNCWMSSNLRVRIVDRHYCKGLYYNQKVEILDVVSLDQCACRNSAEFTVTVQ